MIKAFYMLLWLCLSLLYACTQQTSAEQDSSVHFAIAQAPLNLDPRYATDAASERVNRLIYQSLVDFDATSKPVPRLASWVKSSPTVYRFTLVKQRAPFHHQQALTAADVKATYDSLRTLRNSPNAAEFTNIDHIEIVDNDTVVFHLKQADSYFPAKLILGILPQDLLQQGHDFTHNPIGSGPLRFVQWQNKLVLQRTADKQIITLQEVRDPMVRVLKLLRGEVDLLQGDLPPELVGYLRQQQTINVSTGMGGNFSYLGLNMQDPVLKNLKVRQAIAYAIDRQEIISKAMVPNTREADAILPPEHYTRHADALKPYAYNPELAKKLLLEAGIKLPLKLVYKTSTDAQRVRFATILQAQMRRAGINLEIRSLDWGTFFEEVKQGNFQLYGLTWVGIKTPEIYAKAFASQSVPPQGFNRGRYADNELDKLLASEDWHAVTAHIHQQLPYIPLWYEGQFVAMHHNLKNYAPKPDGNWDDLATITKYAH